MKLYYQCIKCKTDNFFKVDGSNPSYSINGLEFSCDKCKAKYQILVKPLSRDLFKDDYWDKKINDIDDDWQVPRPGDFELLDPNSKIDL